MESIFDKKVTPILLTTTFDSSIPNRYTIVMNVARIPDVAAIGIPINSGLTFSFASSVLVWGREQRFALT